MNKRSRDILWIVLIFWVVVHSVVELIRDPSTWLIAAAITAVIFAPILWIRHRRKARS